MRSRLEPVGEPEGAQVGLLDQVLGVGRPAGQGQAGSGTWTPPATLAEGPHGSKPPSPPASRRPNRERLGLPIPSAGYARAYEKV